MTVDVQLAILIATVALNLALALAVGAALAVLWLTSATTPWAAARLRSVLRARLGACVAAMLALASLLPLVSAFMAEVPIAEAGEAMYAMLTDSHFGLAWALGMGASLAAVMASVVPASEAGRRMVALFGLLALAVALYTRSMVSHAAADGDLSLAIVVDWVHLCMISVWVGAVVIAALITLGGGVPAQAADRAQLAGYIDKLSCSATHALVGIVATGLVSAWHNLGSVSGLTGNAYANVLLSKLALVALAILLGGANRLIVMPSLLARLRAPSADAAAPLGRFARIVRIEAVVLLAVLVAAALLSATSPPASA